MTSTLTVADFEAWGFKLIEQKGEFWRFEKHSNSVLPILLAYSTKSPGIIAKYPRKMGTKACIIQGLSINSREELDWIMNRCPLLK